MSSRKEVKFYKAQGICPVCQKNEPEFGHVTCASCLARIKQYNEIHREQHNAGAKESMKKKRENGLCLRCGKPAKGKAYCVNCAQINSIRKKIVYRRKKEGRYTGKIFDDDTLYKIALAALHKWGLI